MMRKIFLLLLFVIFLPPVWAGEELFGEISNDASPNFTQEQPQEQPPVEEISLFEQENADNNPNPYSVYTGKDTTSHMTLNGGVRLREEPPSNVTVAKDGSLMTIKSRKNRGELLVGDLNPGKPVNDSFGGFLGYHFGRFSIAHNFERTEFKQELARSGMAIEPEIQLTKNLKFKTSFRTVQSQKGYTQGVALEYGKTNSRFKNVNNLKLEVKASTSTTPGSAPVQRFGFNTKYYF